MPCMLQELQGSPDASEARGSPRSPERPLPAAASLRLARSRARAVVDSTAVGSFAAAALASCVIGGGYANSDGRHPHVTCASAWAF